MLLSTLITQLADNRQDRATQGTEDGPARPRTAPHRLAATRSFFVIDDGTVVVRKGKKIVLLCRPGHVSRLVVDRLRSSSTVSAKDLMDEHGLTESTATTALERLAEQWVITPEPGAPYRLRRDRAYQLSKEFAAALAHHDDKRHIY